MPATEPKPVEPQAKAVKMPSASLTVSIALVVVLGLLAVAVNFAMKTPTPTPAPTPTPGPAVLTVPRKDFDELKAQLLGCQAKLVVAEDKILRHAEQLKEHTDSVAHWQVLFKESCDKVAKLREELELLKNTPQTEVKQGLPTKQSRVLDELPPDAPPPDDSKET